MDDSLLKSTTSEKTIVDENNNIVKSNLVTCKSLETGLNTKGILRSGSPSRVKRKVFISPLFEVIPDAWEAKSIPSIPCPSPLRKCASPLSLFYRLSPGNGADFFSRTFDSPGKSGLNAMREDKNGNNFANRLYGANSFESLVRKVEQESLRLC